MPPIIALIACIGLVIFLLAVEHKNNPKASLALWIPTIWLMICGSRPVGYWFEGGLGLSLEEGSPYDRVILSALITFSIIVLFRRKVEWLQVIKNNYILILLYAFLGISIFWSDYQYISLKRWIRLLGAIPVALVVLSEKSPFDAIESIFRRCAYVLIPFSLVLIKYYPKFGADFGRWSGLTMWTGVTITKNSLGQLCAFSVFFLIWTFIRNKKEKRADNSLMRKPADYLVIALSLFMLAGIGGAFSATSSAVLAIGILMLLILYRFANSRTQIAVCLLILTVASWIMLVYSDVLATGVAALLQRDITFTGRADIWKLALEVGNKHPIWGAGFGGYWVTGNEISERFSGFLTAHNGLLDVYIEIGAVGVLILLWFHLALYRRFIKEIGINTGWALFSICFLIMSFLYNYTESIFLKSSLYIWNITIFMALIFIPKNANNITADQGSSVSEIG